MTVFVAFLRAINVGGTGMLPMKDLAALCTGLGLEDVRTYIQSGNIVFKGQCLYYSFTSCARNPATEFQFAF